ncbi:MAG: hypothetical protein IKX54_00635 [Lachnospiraceae bacterium]|nr:hypothetical protein [Lachnospiraceae bacterium]
MRKVKLIVLAVLVMAMLAACGKDTKDGDKKPEVTATPTPAESKDGTPTPTPTEEPAVLTGTPFERLITAAHNAFADGNYSFSATVTAKQPTETEPTTQANNYRFIKCDDGELAFKESIYEDGTKQHEYAFLHPNGGVHLYTWWGDSKMNYEYVPISKEDAGYMYAFVYGLHEPGDEAFHAFVHMCAEIFPDWPKTLIPENASLSTLLAPFGSTEFLEKTFGYHQNEDGSDVFLIRREMLEKLFKSLETGFPGLLYYYGDNALSRIEQCGDIEITVSYDGAMLQEIAMRFELADGTKAEQKYTVSNIGTTQINLPAAAKEKFEKMKFEPGNEEEPSNWASWLKQYQQDALAGRVDQDVKTVNDLLQTIWDCVQDETINNELKEIVAKEKDRELIIYYSEGSNYDKTGVPSIDAKLKEKFGNAKIKMESVMWVPLSLQIYFIPDGPDGTVQMYFDLN